MLVNVKELTPEQSRQTFAKDHVRGDSEQKAWLESEKSIIQAEAAKRSFDAEPLGYRITGKTVMFRRGLSLTERELKDILLRM